MSKPNVTTVSWFLHQATCLPFRERERGGAEQMRNLRDHITKW